MTAAAHRSDRSQRAQAAGWLAGADTAGLLYGAIVSAGVLVTVSAHADASVHVSLATSVVLVVYYLAHVYIYTISRQFDGDRRPFLRRLGSSSVHELGVLQGGVPALVVYVVTDAMGAGKDSAAAVAVYFSVALLAVVGYLGAHRAGLRGLAALPDVLAAAFFGVLIMVAKSLLH